MSRGPRCTGCGSWDGRSRPSSVAMTGSRSGCGRRVRRAMSRASALGSCWRRSSGPERASPSPALSRPLSAASGLVLAGIVVLRRRRRPDRARAVARPRGPRPAGADRGRAADRARVPDALALGRRGHPRCAAPRRAHRHRRAGARVRARRRRRECRDAAARRADDAAPSTSRCPRSRAPSTSCVGALDRGTPLVEVSPCSGAGLARRREARTCSRPPAARRSRCWCRWCS